VKPKYSQGQEDQLLLLGCDNAFKSDRLGHFDMTYSYCDTILAFPRSW
jgi:hypothetical protein